jgi:hypothetical protein
LKPHTINPFRFISFCLILVICFSCSNDDTTTSDSRFTTLYNDLFSPDCKNCHKPGADAYANFGVTLDFSTQDTAHSTLTSLKVQATNADPDCNGAVDLVVTGVPEKSYLAAVLISSYLTDDFAGVSGCTPFHSTTLSISSEEQSSIETWILEGATN